MNNYFFRLLLHAVALMVCLVLCTACPGPHTDDPDYVVASKKKLEFPWQSGSSKSLTIDTNASWMMDGPGNRIGWLSADPLSGGSGVTPVVLRTTQDNDNEKERSGILYVTTGEAIDTIHVSQAARPITYYLNVYPQVMGFEHRESSQDFVVNTNDEWTATSSDASWCVVNKNGDNNVTVKVTENNTNKHREATITITGTKSQLPATVQVTQKATSEFGKGEFDQDKSIDDNVIWLFDVTPTELSFDAEGASQTIHVTGNDDWTATSSEPTWCNLSTSGGNSESSIEVTVERNPSTYQRQAVIIVTGTHTGKVVEVNVTQKGCSEFDRNDYDPDKDMDMHYEFSVDPTGLTFKMEGETKALNINGNDDWTAMSSNESWCILSESKGAGPATIYVSAMLNDTPTIRQTTIILKGKYTEKMVTVYVTQEGAAQGGKSEFDRDDYGPDTDLDSNITLSVSPSSLIFDNSAGTKSFTITGNGEWTAESSATSWCTLSKGSGTGTSTVNVTVTKNANSSQRTATITVKGKQTGKTFTVSITQKGISGFDHEDYDPDKDLDNNYSFSVSTTSLSFESAANSKSFTITGNDEWMAESSATSWCTLSKVSGAGTATVNVTVTKNGSSSQRTATITVKGKQTGKTLTVSITQKGTSGFDHEDYDPDKDLDNNYSFSVSTTSLSFESTANSKSFTITGNDEWTAESSATSWCTVSKKSGTGSATVNVTVAKNTTSSQRSAIITVKGKYTSKIIQVSVSQKGSTGFDREGYDQNKNLDK